MARWHIRRFLGRTCVVAAAAVVLVDITYDRALSRNARTLGNGARLAWAYKFTTPQSLEELSALHDFAATLILDTCLANEGLYIKFGQGLSTMNHVLPPEYTNRLRVLLDRAPEVPFAKIKATVEQSLKCPIEELFETFDVVPVASASIAQVHRATIRLPGEEVSRQVAVKVQKPFIRNQAWLDLVGNRIVCIALQYLFDIPLVWSADTIEKEMMREINFVNEARNIERAEQLFADREDIAVPQVFGGKFLDERVLVTEWIDAIKLSEVERVERTFSSEHIMDTLCQCFGDMVFRFGFVHCDPHPANVLVRRRPPSAGALSPPIDVGASYKNSNDHQVVLLDFGLCIDESISFRQDYAKVFKALFTNDRASLESIVASWGIGHAELFASLQLQKPFTFKSSVPVHMAQVSTADILRFQRQLKEQISSLLVDERRVPRELVFVGRAFNILRSLNKSFGAPVNRVNIFAQRAVGALAEMNREEDLFGAGHSIHRQLWRSACRAAGEWRFGVTLWFLSLWHVFSWRYNSMRVLVARWLHVSIAAAPNLEDLMEKAEAQTAESLRNPLPRIHEND